MPNFHSTIKFFSSLTISVTYLKNTYSIILSVKKQTNICLGIQIVIVFNTVSTELILLKRSTYNITAPLKSLLNVLSHQLNEFIFEDYSSGKYAGSSTISSYEYTIGEQ